MTQQIKSRIEQIRRGEVPNGYKKTTLGIIPAEWEITRFKKKFDRLMRKNEEGNTNVLTISAQFGLVNQEEFFNKSVASDDKSNYFLLNRGEYAYNKSYSNGYPFGAIKRLDKYEKGIVSPLYICFSASNGNEFPEFYLQYFEAGKMNSEIHAFAQEGARNHGLLNISVDDFFNSLIISPSLPEQKKIAEILETQDRVIELYEKKIEQLKKLKKVFLQKMFPKSGSTVPEWRFPEFKEDWEQRKFNEIYEKNDERNEGQFSWDKTISISSMTFNENGNGASDESLASYKVLRIGDVAFEGHTSKEYRYGRFVLNDLENGIMSPRFTTLRPIVDQDYDFWKYYIHDERVMRSKLVNSTKAGTMMNELVIDDLFKQDILFPAIDEQRKIGLALRNIDNLITLHQRKCDEEKQKKKALMQLLLTGIVRVKV